MRTITSILSILSGKVVLNQFLGRLKLHRFGLLEGLVFQGPKTCLCSKVPRLLRKTNLKAAKLPVKKSATT